MYRDLMTLHFRSCESGVQEEEKYFDSTDTSKMDMGKESRNITTYTH